MRVFALKYRTSTADNSQDSTLDSRKAGAGYRVSLQPVTNTLPLFKVQKKRADLCAEIEFFFTGNLGEKFPSKRLHEKFGTSFRARVSEINENPDCRIRIRNKTRDLVDGLQVSVYWAELREPSTPSQKQSYTLDYETGRIR